MGLIFVTGGAKSGKSKFAEEMLLKLNNGKQKNIYLATSLIFDEEMKEKIRLHKKRRKNDWFTVERKEGKTIGELWKLIKILKTN